MVQGNQIHEVELISFTLSSWVIIIWVWVKIRYPNNWMVNTKLD